MQKVLAAACLAASTYAIGLQSEEERWGHRKLPAGYACLMTNREGNHKVTMMVRRMVYYAFRECKHRRKFNHKCMHRHYASKCPGIKAAAKATNCPLFEKRTIKTCDVGLKRWD